jgi:hypothetical protein
VSASMRPTYAGEMVACCAFTWPKGLEFQLCNF